MVFERKPSANIAALSTELVRRINDNTRRIRSMEQRMDGMESRMGVLEETVIEKIEELKVGFDKISVDLKSLIKRLDEMETEILKINKELEKVARKSEVNRLENMIEIYSPIKSTFVTRDELQRILEKKRVKV